tara:strand:- start:683 stop:1018 length:336 start_codon:yes stop_codon:yes gene_type:complete
MKTISKYLFTSSILLALIFNYSYAEDIFEKIDKQRQINEDDLSRLVLKSEIVGENAYWLVQYSTLSGWSKVALFFGYVDNKSACEDAKESFMNDPSRGSPFECHKIKISEQ